MKRTTIKEFDAMTLEQAVDFKKKLGLESVTVEFMDHRTKEWEKLDDLHTRNVRNLADSKHGSAVQDVLEQRQREARHK
jgi:hypothetical protein